MLNTSRASIPEGGRLADELCVLTPAGTTTNRETNERRLRASESSPNQRRMNTHSAEFPSGIERHSSLERGVYRPYACSPGPPKCSFWFQRWSLKLQWKPSYRGFRGPLAVRLPLTHQHRDLSIFPIAVAQLKCKTNAETTRSFVWLFRPMKRCTYILNDTSNNSLQCTFQISISGARLRAVAIN